MAVDLPSRELNRWLAGALWVVVIAVHVVAAALWWWATPGGFPVGHARFWLNQVVPIVLVAFAVILVLPPARALRPALLAAVPATYLAAAIAGRVLFPITLRTLWLAPLAIGLVLGLLWWRLHRTHAKRAVAFAGAGSALGVFLAVAHAGPPPSTHPASAQPEDLAALGAPAVTYTAGPLSFYAFAQLSFVSRSPDACWTLLATAADRTGPLDERVTQDSHLDERGALHVDVRTSVPRVVYSHLNTFTALSVSGHRHLYVAFSPAPDVRIELLPVDYPVGRPARFAYVAADRTFHVVEASSAEKGPFTDLARGTLAPTDPLAITFYDEDTPVARVTFDDFAAQASTELSPTAGWGVPQNAIEMRLAGDSPGSPAELYVTLAGTSVGRGFESVAHAPGVYRNRMHFERL